ncbi:hypothetical protein ABPG72_013730 [Tetrahymena utriculariae]
MNSNLLKESDVHFCSEMNDLEKEALDRLQKIRQRIIHEDENEQSKNTIESSNGTFKTKKDQDQNRYSTYETQQSQANTFSNQLNSNNKISSNNFINYVESSNNLKEQYYFKLPPKGSKSNLNAGSTIADTQHVRTKSKDLTRSSVKFEENIEKNTFQNDARNEHAAVKNSRFSSSSFSNEENSLNSKKRQDVIEQSKRSQDNLDNLNQQKEQMKYSQKISKSSISNSPISQVANKNNQVATKQFFNESQKEKTQNKIERQIEDRLRRYEVSPKKQEQQAASQTAFTSQNQIQRQSNSFSACNKADDTDQSVDVSQIEKLQQKVIERKKSIDQINAKLSEKLNSPQPAIQQSKSHTPQSDTTLQKSRAPFDQQYEEYYQTNTSPSNFNAIQPFPPQTNPCPFLTGQKNIPIQAPNQFFSSVSSQHRLSAMVTQLSPNNQYNKLQQNANVKENQINQSTNSAGSFSKETNEKQANHNKRALQMQSDHSTIKDKDETLDFQEDTIHDLSKKLEAASQQSKRQQEEIQQLRQKIQSNNQITTQRKSKDQKNAKEGSSLIRVSTTSSVRGLMQKNTKRAFNEKIIVEGESDLDDMSSSRDIIDDAISITEENLDLKNEIIRFKEKIEDKEIENKKQSQMLLEQRNLIKKQEKEIEDLRTKCKEYEIGYSNVQKDVELIEKQYFIKKLKENNNLENEMFQQYNDELVKENSEILHKAAKLLEKYKELEYEYKKLLSEKEEEQHWKSVVQKRDQDILTLNRELNYIKSNQLKELSEYKEVIDRLGTNLETHDVKQIIKKFIEVCSQNKKHLEFQKQFYDIISSCQDPAVRKSEPLGAKESWDLFKKIFQDYLELRKKDRLDITLGNLLIKSLKIKSREEIIPEFTKKIMENEAYCNIIHKVKYHLNINHDCSIQELSSSIDQLLSKKLYYK